MTALVLPPYTEAQLGPERAAQVRSLRARLLSAGIVLPPWIDARPGRLQLVIGDLAADPPLARSAEELALSHSDWLLRGLLALQLATAAPRAALHVPAGAALAVLRRELANTTIEIHEAQPAWPSRPELDIAGAFGRCFVASPTVLDRAAAALSGGSPRRLCTIAGAVARPTVLGLGEGMSPRDLVERAGGATIPDWIALVGGPMGRLWSADEPVQGDEALLLILPTGHRLVRARRRPLSERLHRAAAACLGCRLCSDGCPEPAAGSALLPHRIVSLLSGAEDPLGRGRGDEPALLLALDCSGCGACDALCPHGLGPAGLVGDLAHRLRKEGLHAPPLPLLDAPAKEVPRLSLRRLLSQLGLDDYAPES